MGLSCLLQLSNSKKQTFTSTTSPLFCNALNLKLEETDSATEARYRSECGNYPTKAAITNVIAGRRTSVKPAVTT